MTIWTITIYFFHLHICICSCLSILFYVPWTPNALNCSKYTLSGKAALSFLKSGYIYSFPCLDDVSIELLLPKHFSWIYTLFLKKDLFYFMYLTVLPTCISVYQLHAYCPQRSEKTLDSLKLELWILLSCHMDARNIIWVLCKVASHWAIFPALISHCSSDGCLLINSVWGTSSLLMSSVFCQHFFSYIYPHAYLFLVSSFGFIKSELTTVFFFACIPSTNTYRTLSFNNCSKPIGICPWMKQDCMSL